MAVTEPSIVLVLGSGPAAMMCRDWPRVPFTHIVAINNAWRVRRDWTHLLCPDDFPAARRPDAPGTGQSVITSERYVPAQNRFGGVVYAGGTMAFTAGYWALAALRPQVLAYWGCDMVYPGQGHTHFYGNGKADPLRRDVTLRSLEAKSARLWLQAAKAGCRVVNLSQAPSRLLFPVAARQELAALSRLPVAANLSGMAAAEEEEARLDYHVASGRYWEEAARFDPALIDALDRLWSQAFARAMAPQTSGRGAGV